ncbi:hypothetical protein DFQ26_000390, partial [Actinomortierella ambigua]
TASDTTAIVYLGNSGSGRSALLNKLGGDFSAGVAWREGVTKNVSEKLVDLNGEKVLLVDVPGLFEPKKEATKRNARMLTEALRRGYRYNLTFVLKASNRGFEHADLLMMSKVNECVRQADGAKITFKVIINQIMDDAVYDMYDKTVVKDNFQCQLAELKEEGYHFDISIKSVLLLRHAQDFAQNTTFKDVLTKFECSWQQKAHVVLDKDISATNEDLYDFIRLMGPALMWVYNAGALAAAAVGATAAGALAVGAEAEAVAAAVASVGASLTLAVPAALVATGAYLLLKRDRNKARVP